MEEVFNGLVRGDLNVKPASKIPSCYCSKNVPMIRLTPEGVIDCVNDCFCRVSSFMPRNKLLGHFVGEFAVLPEDSVWFREGLRQLRAREVDVVRRECEVSSMEGDPVNIDFLLMAKRDMDGNLVHVACILQDITPCKLNEQKLMDALKEQERLNERLGTAHEEMRISLDRLSIQTEGDDLNEMRMKLTEVAESAELRSRRQTASLAGVSHDIRTPLSAINGFADLLAEAETQEEKEEYLSIIHTNSRLISDLLKSILDLEMLESGQFRFQCDRVDLRRLGTELCSIYNVVKSEHEVEVTFIPEENPEIIFSTDSNQFRRILNNLIGNAVKNTEVGRVCLSYEKVNGFIQFAVSDTGRGIPSDKLRSIFNRYERLRRDYNGFGLGLTICQSLVDAMGGKIWVTSELGKGSTFYFTLPLKS